MSIINFFIKGPQLLFRHGRAGFVHKGKVASYDAFDQMRQEQLKALREKIDKLKKSLNKA